MATQPRKVDRRNTDPELDAILIELAAIRDDMAAAPAMSPIDPREAHANYSESALNLLHYLALRRRDLRPLQMKLAVRGLSSLGRAESHVMFAVDSVLTALHRLAGRPLPTAPNGGAPLDLARGQQLLEQHADALLGPGDPERDVRIMVTMPGEAAIDYTLVHDLMRQGMNCMRINCAHDTASSWAQMIEHLRRAERTLGKSCRVVMDLAGPKLRTGPLEPGPAVIRLRPQRDVFGRVAAPARVWLTDSSAPRQSPSPADGCLQIPAAWLESLCVDERIRLRDARESRRVLRVVDVAPGGCWAEATQTIYLVPSTILRRSRRGGESGRKASVGSLPPRENSILLEIGDTLMLTRDQRPGRPATRDAVGRILTPAVIGCTIPDVFDDVRSGESIWFDDGKIGGVIDAVESDHIQIRITHARPGGDKLRADKGINLPESNLGLPALTAKDLEDLKFAAQHADVIELSFANSASDVESLQRELAALGPRTPAIVLKIETRRGFENLPAMLLAAMRAPCCGVMIARGDLAVECGFERLAEVQEEILWVCEAAHVPVIWATQVLETLAKQGIPSRAEISDAAMGHRAECVMLNKGPHIVSAVRVLDDILRRMRAHQAKKRSMLRELRLAHTLPGIAGP